MTSNDNKGFTSKVGLIMAAAGGAVGLGNIWKFPYIAGENGGGAFLIVYLLCVLLFGMPLLMTEFLIGKRSGKSAYGAFRALDGSKKWDWLSWLCVITAILIMAFYFIVTGWCFNYFVEALTNVFKGMETAALEAHFTKVTTNPLRMVGFSLLPVVLTATVLWFGVKEGIERLSKILMPLLLVMMFLMVGRVLMLDNSNIGMQFFFRIDFSQITPKVIMEVMGQCFFSLSIGMGALITYGAYMPQEQNVTATSIQVIVLDTLVAILAGLIIFPAGGRTRVGLRRSAGYLGEDVPLLDQQYPLFRLTLHRGRDFHHLPHGSGCCLYLRGQQRETESPQERTHCIGYRDRFSCRVHLLQAAVLDLR